jgi:hypothetical protein
MEGEVGMRSRPETRRLLKARTVIDTIALRAMNVGTFVEEASSGLLGQKKAAGDEGASATVAFAKNNVRNSHLQSGIQQ